MSWGLELQHGNLGGHHSAHNGGQGPASSETLIAPEKPVGTQQRCFGPAAGQPGSEARSTDSEAGSLAAQS